MSPSPIPLPVSQGKTEALVALLAKIAARKIAEGHK